ncbi:MAG: MlaD family protein [Actinomycetota bacterium]|nr:MlaD family protein [Actinomycetota bacterium]
MSPSGPGAVRIRGGRISRGAAVAALALVTAAVAFILLTGGGGGTTYKLLFETGGQLVSGNEVLIGGNPVGSVKEVGLTDNGEAEVVIEVDEPLHDGSSAVIRSTSLSGVANRYISITPGPDNAPELEDGQLITQVDTTTPVDLDQLFNTFDEETRKALSDVIQGSATVYAGRGPEANEAYRYLSPALSETDRLFKEVTADEQVLTDFLVDGSRVVTALAERRDDLSGLVSSSNQALGAVAAENESFDRALLALPPALRQANTTFVNLRATLDDLDPFVAASKPATKDLAPFLRKFKGVAKASVPVFHDLAPAVQRNGKKNDLADATGDFVSLERAASGAVGPTIAAMVRADPVLRFTRPYAPELLVALGKLGQITGQYEASGHYARVEPSGLGLFDYTGGAAPNLVPITTAAQYDGYLPAGGPNFKVFHRCPGGTTQAIAGSNPFLDGGGLTTPAPPGDCTVTDVPLGP